MRAVYLRLVVACSFKQLDEPEVAVVLRSARALGGLVDETEAGAALVQPLMSLRRRTATAASDIPGNGSGITSSIPGSCRVKQAMLRKGGGGQGLGDGAKKGA